MNNKKMKYNMHTIMSCHVKVNEENRTWKEKAELGRLFTFDEQALQSITLSIEQGNSVFRVRPSKEVENCTTFYVLIRRISEKVMHRNPGNEWQQSRAGEWRGRVSPGCLTRAWRQCSVFPLCNSRLVWKRNQVDTFQLQPGSIQPF